MARKLVIKSVRALLIATFFESAVLICGILKFLETDDLRWIVGAVIVGGFMSLTTGFELVDENDPRAARGTDI